VGGPGVRRRVVVARVEDAVAEPRVVLEQVSGCTLGPDPVASVPLGEVPGQRVPVLPVWRWIPSPLSLVTFANKVESFGRPGRTTIACIVSPTNSFPATTALVTGLEPATSGVTGRAGAEDVRGWAATDGADTRC
jgi:hypothetical protein